MQTKKTNTMLAVLFFLTALAIPFSAVAAAPVDFRELVKNAMPAVVNISTERTEQLRSFGTPFDLFRGHPDFDQFFGPFQDFYGNQGAPRQRKTSSLGSGFIISADGYIVTNNHVIDGADSIRVNIGAKNKKDDLVTAKLVGSDPETDLALLKIDAKDLPFLSFGNSDALDVGEWVVAIGSPLGLHHTVTAGIVSAKGRNIQSGSYDDYLQTDASINSGNSGGPLLNLDGEVVGINTAIARNAQGIGFAIPSSMAQKIILQLKDNKKVRRGWLGVTIQNVDSATAKALEMDGTSGVLVNSVLEGQPAALAGIKEGDVILAINDQAVEDTEQLLRKVALLDPGSKANITVWRDGKKETLELTVAERDNSGSGKAVQSGTQTDSLLGLKLRTITSDDMRRFNLSSNKGLLVTGLDQDSKAAEAGIQPGDVILAVNKRSVNSVQEMEAKIKAAKEKQGAVLLHVARKGTVFYRAIELKDKK